MLHFYKDHPDAFTDNTWIISHAGVNVPYPDKWYKIVSCYNNNLCLDIAPPLGNCSNIRVCTYTGSTNQQWKFQYAPSGYRTLVSRANPNLVADITLDAPVNNGSNVYAYTDLTNSNSYPYGINQLWKLSNIVDDKFVITTIYWDMRDRCLDIGNAGGIVSGSNVQIWAYGGGSNQQWKFIEVQ